MLGFGNVIDGCVSFVSRECDDGDTTLVAGRAEGIGPLQGCLFFRNSLADKGATIVQNAFQDILDTHFFVTLKEYVLFLHFGLDIHPWNSEAHPVSHSSNLFPWRTDIISIHGHRDHTVNGDYTTQPVF